MHGVYKYNKYMYVCAYESVCCLLLPSDQSFIGYRMDVHGQEYD